VANERLRAAILASGLGIQATADAVGVDRKTIERWISGRTPYRRHQYALASLLAVDLPYLWPDSRPTEEVSAMGQAEVVAISVDTPFAQEAWAQKEKIGITLASDLNKETAKAYGTLLPDLIGLGAVSARAAFVIDKNGVIQYSEQTPSPKELPNFHRIKETLGKLK